MKTFFLINIIPLAFIVSVGATPFKTAVVMEVVKDVKVSKDNQKAQSAKVKESITGSDVLTTGQDSRAELRFQDNTLARVGSNSIFSFKEDQREINLQQGSVLFHSDKGKGGGQIRTAAATAAVTGTTIIVSATKNGGFKLLILEGKSRLILKSGVFIDLQAGQMTFINPGQDTRPAVLSFDIEQLVKGSKLVEGFADPLDSLTKVEDAINKQNKLIEQGKMDETGLLMALINEEGQVQLIDMNSLTQILDIDLVVDNAQEQLDAVANPYAALKAAFAQDLIIDSSSIPNSRLFNDVALLQSSPFNINGPLNDAPINTFYYPAQNIYFNTPLFDTTPFEATGEIAFIASQNIYFNGNTYFSGTADVVLVALQDIIFNPGSSITAIEGTYLDFHANGSMYMGNSTIIDSDGPFPHITIDVLGDLIGNGTYINAMNFSAYVGGDMDLTDVEFSGPIQDFFTQVSGNVTVSGGTNFFGGFVNITGDSTVNIDSNYTGAFDDIHIGGLENVTLTDSYLTSSDGNIYLDSSGPLLSLINSQLSANSSNSSAGAVNLYNNNGSISLNNSTISAQNFISLDVENGNILLNNSSLSASGTSGFISIFNNNTAGQILLTDATLSASGASGSISINNPGGLIDIYNSTIQTSITAQNISLSAHTINLQNIIFPTGSTVTLGSQLGSLAPNPNTSASSVAGKVNFINNVYYGGGNPAENEVPITQGGTYTGTTPMINIIATP